MSQEKSNNAIVEKILSGARWATALRVTAQAISWLSTIIVVRFIAPDDYGLNAMLEAPLELILLFSTLGLDIALTRAKKLEHEQLQSAFGWLLAINLSLFSLYFFCAPLLAEYFHEPRLELLARVVAFIFLLLPFRIIPNALMNRNLEFKLQSTVELVASIAAVITTLTLAILGTGVWALVIGVLVNRALIVIILMIVRPWFIMPSVNFAAARGMLTVGGMTMLWAGLVLIGDKLPGLIGGPKLGGEGLGLFAVSMQFALLPLSKVMPIINPILFPAFSKFQDQRAVASDYLNKLLGVISLVLFPVMVGNACIAHVFVPVVLGDKWLAANLPLVLLSLAMPFRLITSLLRPVMNAMGRIDLALKSTLVMLTAMVPLTIVGVNYGVTGLVAAVLLTEPIAMLATIGLSKMVLDTSFVKIASVIFPAILSSAIMAAAIAAVRFFFEIPNPLGELFFEVGLGAVTYFLAIRFLFKQSFETAIRLIRSR